MFGLGKPRTKLGEWLKARGLTQGWLQKASGFNKDTITSLCGDVDYKPRNGTMQKIIKALREVDPSVKAEHFWDL